jgi:hypothetical protein
VATTEIDRSVALPYDVRPARWIGTVRLVSVGLVLAYGLGSIVAMRNLSAVGSWTLLDSLVHEGYWMGDPYRLVGTYLAQTPVALLIYAGVNDVGILQVAHGVGYVLVPALAWAGALFLSRRTVVFEFLLLGYCATTLTSDFIAVADFNQLFAFTALCFAAIVRYFATGERALPWIAFAASCVVALSHGFALFLAPILLLAMVVLRRRSGRRDGRVAWALTTAMLVAAVLVSILAIVKPYSIGNLVTATDMATPLQNAQLVFLVAWLVLLPLAVLARSRVVRRVVGAILVLALAWFVLDSRLWAAPVERHASRTISGLLLAVLLGMALVVVLQGSRDPDGVAATGRPAAVLLPFALFVALLVPVTVQAVEYHRYIEDFRAAIVGGSGRMSNEAFLAQVPAAATYEWPYGFPSMSMLLGLGRQHATVLNPPSKFIPPFDIDDPPVVPGRFAQPFVEGAGHGAD